MKNKYTRKSASELFFDFTIKGNKAKKTTKRTLVVIGYILALVEIMFCFWTLYMLAYACM